MNIHRNLPVTAGQTVRDELAGRLLTLYQNNRSEEWRWCEKELSYCNAVLPLHYSTCGQSIPNSAMTDADWSR